MVEDEWLSGQDMLRMLDQANESASRRKLRLFACACCRRFCHLLPTDAARVALETSEEIADGRAKFAAMAGAKRAVPVLSPWDAAGWASNCAHFAAGRIAKHAALSAYSTSNEVAQKLGQPFGTNPRYYANLLRCICGNPFRPIALAASHRTPTIVSLAQAAYDERQLPSGDLDLHRLAVLADALEEAGAPELVVHLRGPGPHVRGCHVIDLLVGKS
jgi:hypothetical protein